MTRFIVQLFLALALVTTVTRAQNVSEVDSFRANVQIESNSICNKVILTFKPLDQGTKKRLVYVIQVNAGEDLPMPRTADARVFRSKGLIAVRFGEETGTAFSFPEYEIPASLTQFNWKRVKVFGIAEYGAGTPIAEDKISELTSATACSARRFDDLPEPIGCTGNCSAGGIGATSCSAGSGSCSVTCSGSYYACCNVSTNNCFCCSNNPQ